MSDPGKAWQDKKVFPDEPGDGPPRVERLANSAIEDGRGVVAAMGQSQ